MWPLHIALPLLFIRTCLGQQSVCYIADGDCWNPTTPLFLQTFDCAVSGSGSCWCGNARICNANVQDGAVYCGTSQVCTAIVTNGAVFSQLTGVPRFIGGVGGGGDAVSVFMQRTPNGTIQLVNGNVYCEESADCSPEIGLEDGGVGSVYCQDTSGVCGGEISSGNILCNTGGQTKKCDTLLDSSIKKECPDSTLVGLDEPCPDENQPVAARPQYSGSETCTDLDLCINETPGLLEYHCTQHADGLAVATGVCFCGDAQTCFIDKDDGTSNCERSQRCIVSQKYGVVHCQQSPDCEVEMTNGDIHCEDAHLCNVRTAEFGNLYCEQSPYCKGNFLITGNIDCGSSIACESHIVEPSGQKMCSDGTKVDPNNGACFGAQATIPAYLLPPPTITIEKGAGPCDIVTGACVSTSKLDYECNIEQTGICYCAKSAVCTATVNQGAIYCGQAQKCIANVTHGVIFAEQAGPQSTFRGGDEATIYLQRASTPFTAEVNIGRVFCEDRSNCAPTVDTGAIFCQQATSCGGSIRDGIAICDHSSVTCDTEILGEKKKVCPNGDLVEISTPCIYDQAINIYQGIDRDFEQGGEVVCTDLDCFNTDVRLAKYTCDQSENPSGNCFCGDADKCVVKKNAGTTECERASTCSVEHETGGIIHCQQSNNCTVITTEGIVMCEEAVICSATITPNSGELHCENANYCEGDLVAGDVFCDSAIACDVKIEAAGGRKICADGSTVQTTDQACFGFAGTFPPEPTPIIRGDESGGGDEMAPEEVAPEEFVTEEIDINTEEVAPEELVTEEIGVNTEEIDNGVPAEMHPISFPRSLVCDSDACCDASTLINHDVEVHFDSDCPQVDGDIYINGCVTLTGCKYEDGTPCQTQECCEEHPLVDSNPSLMVHLDLDCPYVDGDVSLVGCVGFTQCRYLAVEACETDECCQNNPINDPGIPVVFDPDCPVEYGDVYLFGCIGVTQCRQVEGDEMAPEEVAPEELRTEEIGINTEEIDINTEEIDEVPAAFGKTQCYVHYYAYEYSYLPDCQHNGFYDESDPDAYPQPCPEEPLLLPEDYTEDVWFPFSVCTCPDGVLGVDCSIIGVAASYICDDYNRYYDNQFFDLSGQDKYVQCTNDFDPQGLGSVGAVLIYDHHVNWHINALDGAISFDIRGRFEDPDEAIAELDAVHLTKFLSFISCDLGACIFNQNSVTDVNVSCATKTCTSEFPVADGVPNIVQLAISDTFSNDGIPVQFSLSDVNNGHARLDMEFALAGLPFTFAMDCFVGRCGVINHPNAEEEAAFEGGLGWKPPQTYRGIVYNPIPKGVVNSSYNSDYLFYTTSTNDFLVDFDVYNSDFVALWGVDYDHPEVVSRNDLEKLRDDGFNTIHIENWNPQNRDHIPFLDYCEELGLKVFVPIGNFVFLSDVDAYIVRLSVSDRHGLTKTIVDSTRDVHGDIHSAVAGWLVAKDYRRNYIPILDVVDIIEYMYTTLDPSVTVDDHTRPFGVEVEFPRYNEDVDSAGLSTIHWLYQYLDEDIFINRLIYCVNEPGAGIPFIKDAILDRYPVIFDTDFGGIAPIPVMITKFNLNAFEYIGSEEEGGFTEAEADAYVLDKVNSSLTQMKGWIVDEPETNLFNLVGFFLFEFTQEDWKSPYSNQAEQYWGMHELGDNISPVNATTVHWSVGVEYPVQELIPLPGYTSYIAALKGFISPEEMEHIINGNAEINEGEEVAPEEENLVNVEEIVIDSEEIIIDSEEIDTREPTESQFVGQFVLGDTCSQGLCCCFVGDVVVQQVGDGSLRIAIDGILGATCPDTDNDLPRNSAGDIYIPMVLDKDHPDVFAVSLLGQVFTFVLDDGAQSFQIQAPNPICNVVANRQALTTSTPTEPHEDEEIVVEEVPTEDDADVDAVVCDSNMSLTDLLQLVCDLQLRVKELETTHAASINEPSSTPLTKVVISLIVVCAVLVLVSCACFARKNKRREQRSATAVELYRQITG